MALRILLLSMAVLAATGHAAAQPPKGSGLPLAEDRCATCHGEESPHLQVADSLRQIDWTRLFVAQESLGDDVHHNNGVNCHDCHGGDPRTLDLLQAHATVVPADSKGILPFRSSPDEMRKVCADCHADNLASLRASVHRHAGGRDEEGSGRILQCSACHGDDAHRILSIEDDRSPVFLDNQIATCGGCHNEDLATYRESVHGLGLTESGLVNVAVCANCHGSHGIYYAADLRSTLHVTNVAGTCGACHDIAPRLEASVHGSGGGKPGREAELQAPGKQWDRKPTCTDCHQGHNLLDPKRAGFQIESVNLCGNCHPDLSARYRMSLHGELTEMGYESAAKCADCHGAHDILAIGDPNSPLAKGENRLATCRKCHTYATPNFSNFDPHADFHDAENYPLLHFVYQGLLTLFYFFFLFFVIHASLWFVRSFVATLQGGGHKTLVTRQTALVRFEPRQRILYAVLLGSFLGLILTGLPLKYGGQDWARLLARGLGGFESTSVWHHFFGAVAIFGCATHLVLGIRKIRRLREERVAWRVLLFGPDSPVPTHKDLKVLFDMGRWFLGMGPRPVFERWTYWEKFDYWAVYLAAGVIGTSGLLLWYPNLFVRFLPGEVLNIAKVVHSEIGVLAASFLFVFHFYHTHFRPEKFPLDLSALTGLVSEEHLRKHRPEYVERLQREGKLDEIRRRAPSGGHLWGVFLLGAVVYLMGIGLLAVVLLATLGK